LVMVTKASASDDQPEVSIVVLAMMFWRALS